MTPWMKPTSCHRAISRACRSTTASNSASGPASAVSSGIVPADGVVGQRAQRRLVAMRGRPFERADPQVAGGDAGEHRARQRLLAIHGLAGGDHRQAARRGDAERVHRLADDQFPKHRTQGRASVAAAGVRRRPGALQLHVHAAAIGRDLLAQQDRPPVAEAGEVAELMAGVGLRQRPRAVGQRVAGEDGRAVRRIEGADVQAQLAGQHRVEDHEVRIAHRRGRHLGVEQRRQPGVGVLETPAGGAGGGRDGGRRHRDGPCPIVRRVGGRRRSYFRCGSRGAPLSGAGVRAVLSTIASIV